jgi:hypothetical protein
MPENASPPPHWVPATRSDAGQVFAPAAVQHGQPRIRHCNPSILPQSAVGGIAKEEF